MALQLPALASRHRSEVKMHNGLPPLAFATVLVAAVLAATQASAVTFYDSLSTTNGGKNNANTTQWLAGAFTTDNSTYSSLTATLLLAQHTFGSANLDLYTDDGQVPGALIGSFTPPTVTFGFLSNVSFTLSSVSLTPNMNYWIVLHAASGSFDWGWTSDVSANWASSSDAGSMWSGLNAHPPQFRIVSGLTVIGDYNGNGNVDAADYTVWRDTLGSTTDLRADGYNAASSAGVIDQFDFDFWKSNFGRRAGSGAGESSVVPEPTTVALLVIGCAVALVAHRR
jgi:hypothetical protein